MKPIVFAFNTSAELIAAELIAKDLATSFTKPCNTAEEKIEQLRACYCAKQPIIAIGAIAITIRVLGPILMHKTVSPPVLCIDTQARFIIVLLGAHHRANALAYDIASKMKLTAIITTASDTKQANLILEEPPFGWQVQINQNIQPLLKRIAEGGMLSVQSDDDSMLSDLNSNALQAYNDHCEIDLYIGTSQKKAKTAALAYLPPSLILGFGCERLCQSNAIEFVETILKKHDIHPKAIAALTTLTVKADEPACHALAAHFNWPIWLLPRHLLKKVNVPNPSIQVQKEIGIPSVAEASTLALAQQFLDLTDCEFIVSKQKSTDMTCAILKTKTNINLESLKPNASNKVTAKSLPIQPLGHLDIVGTGPGDHSMRSIGLLSAISKADCIVGYKLYLDIIDDLIKGKQCFDTPLGQESKRAMKAIMLANKGHHVALVCSGDPGIYALAALVFELMEARQKTHRFRFSIQIHPGISAFQALAAGAGAFIGHDFCAISLSDLLTSENLIRKRLEMAAQGDFVTALYNPQSNQRKKLLTKAIDIFMRYRHPSTPVIVGRNLGRENSYIQYFRLDQFDTEIVDMLSIVMIANSQSKFLQAAGKKWAFTPRGYRL